MVYGTLLPLTAGIMAVVVLKVVPPDEVTVKE
jgi:hypothetical protein